jgi:hypothetical protein
MDITSIYRIWDYLQASDITIQQYNIEAKYQTKVLNRAFAINFNILRYPTVIASGGGRERTQRIQVQSSGVTKGSDCTPPISVYCIKIFVFCLKQGKGTNGRFFISKRFTEEINTNTTMHLKKVYGHLFLSLQYLESNLEIHFFSLTVIKKHIQEALKRTPFLYGILVRKLTEELDTRDDRLSIPNKT